LQDFYFMWGVNLRHKSKSAFTSYAVAVSRVYPL
jgi:hypothetical protein